MTERPPATPAAICDAAKVAFLEVCWRDQHEETGVSYNGWLPCRRTGIVDRRRVVREGGGEEEGLLGAGHEVWGTWPLFKMCEGDGEEEEYSSRCVSRSSYTLQHSALTSRGLNRRHEEQENDIATTA